MSRGRDNGMYQLEFHVTEAKRLAWAQNGFTNAGALYKSPVRGTKILDPDCVANDLDLAMNTGNGRILNCEIIRSVASEIVDPMLEFDLPSFCRPWVHY